jgi:PAS domain S-box-containing protein
MSVPSEKEADPESQREKIIGLGELSIRKSYYPELQRKHAELLKKNAELQTAYEDLSSKEQQLREKETRLYSILHGSPVMQFVIDHNHHVISWNKAIEKYSGIKTEEIINTDGQWRAFYSDKRPVLADILVDESFDLLPLYYREKFRKSRFIDKGYEITDFFPRIGDNGKWLFATAVPISDAQGHIIGAIETLEDITERKLAEEALQESEARLLMAQEIGHVGSWEYNIKSTRIWGSAEGARIYGFKEDGGWFPLERIESCIPERERVHQALVDLIEKDKEYNLEFAINPEDGTPQKIIMSMARLEKDASGNPMRAVGVIQDITKRKHAEAALRESEKFLNNVVENIPDMIFVKDAKDLRFVRFNRAGEELLGYKRDDLYGKNDYDFFPNDEADFFTRKDRDVLNLRKSLNISEEKIQTRLKGERILHTQKIPILDDTGNPTYLMGISEDITDYKRTEEALNLARNKMALLNNVTFQDIQGAAFALAAYNELLKTVIDDEKGQTYLENQVSLNQKIIDSLNFAKNYQDMGIKPPRWQNVGHVFLLAISHLDFLHIARNMSVEGLEIYADPLLEMVFFHLMQNVLEHGVHATQVTIQYQEKPDKMTLVIEDNGVGIPAEEKHMIFDRGYGKNTGLGLFFAREVLSITKITIKETGEAGKGARLEIGIPRGGYRFADLQ